MPTNQPSHRGSNAAVKQQWRGLSKTNRDNRGLGIMAPVIESGAGVGCSFKHTTLATSRLRFLSIAKIWKRSRRTGIRYRDHYQEQGTFNRLMDRIRTIKKQGETFGAVTRPAGVRITQREGAAPEPSICCA